jgi:hypothetical protein
MLSTNLEARWNPAMTSEAQQVWPKEPVRLFSVELTASSWLHRERQVDNDLFSTISQRQQSTCGTPAEHKVGVRRHHATVSSSMHLMRLSTAATKLLDGVCSAFGCKVGADLYLAYQENVTQSSWNTRSASFTKTRRRRPDSDMDLWFSMRPWAGSRAWVVLHACW